MNKLLDRCIEETTPRMSKAIEGYAPQVMRDIPDFLNTRFAANIKIIDDKIPLRYLGYRYMSPEEEHRAGLSKNTKTTIDIAESSLYMVEFKFSYDGQPITKQVLLPYSERGNLMKISNTTYVVSPVVSDRVFTPSDNSIFAKLAITKINFNSIVYNIRLNGVKIPMQVIYSNEIIRIKVNADNIGKPIPPIALYLLAKYGLRGTIEKYFNGKEGDIKLIYGEVSEEDKKEYAIYQSCKERPRSHRDTTYLGHDTKILVRNEISDDVSLINLVSSIIYALDMLPELGEDAVEVFNNPEYAIDDFEKKVRIFDVEKEYWLLLLGKLVFKDVWSPGRIITDMRKNLAALDYYLDDYSKSIARYEMEDFFDMIKLLLGNYNKWIIEHKEFNGSLENKFVDMISYLSHDISYAYTKTLLNINKRFYKSANGVSFKEVSKIFQELSPKKIFTLVKSNATNLTLTVADCNYKLCA